MLITILHQPNQRIEHLQKNLKRENINVEHRILEDDDLAPGFFESHAFIFYCDSVGCDSLLFITRVRTIKRSIPIIVVDSSERPEIKKKALELGADCYFSEPIAYHSLALFIKNLIFRKTLRNANRWLRAFDVWLDVESRFAKREQFSIPLRHKEFELLEFFIINRGKILTRNTILENVWDRNANFASNTVDVHINRLRRKIDDPFREKLIHTIHCLGYVFEKRPALSKKTGALKIKAK
ncbi:response regulator transcription factor [Candidatus Peregrinibacteria bacterium]|nr:response regulator transcription factor [Candidatus Peregrinibacteria bacterium]